MFPFAANGRAMTLESTDGFVRVVARKDNHLILGWQAVGKGVSELSAAFSQSIEVRASGAFIFFTTLLRQLSAPTLWDAMLFASCTRAIAIALPR